MSSIEIFKENSGIFDGEANRIDQHAFDLFAEKHGKEAASGYFKAMTEFTEVLNKILYVKKFDTEGFRETKSIVLGKVSNLHNALFNFSEGYGVDLKHLNKPEDPRTICKGF